ncbi:MAG TPA: hypothetical protein DCQ04_01565, partial [Actinobacteria bacterium]|nr:hypothetical protein [Actinomycetota bacterium]
MSATIIEHLATELDRVSPWHDDLLITARDSSTGDSAIPGSDHNLLRPISILRHLVVCSFEGESHHV